MVTGLDVDLDSPLDFDCEACILAKHHTLPFPSKSLTQNLEVGDVVVCDVWGKASTLSLQNNIYYISFTDLASRYTLLFFLSLKSQAVRALEHVHNFFVTQKGRTLRICRVDNAKELTLGDFEAFLLKHGIILETTAPYSSSQNGVAERLNRTLVERARAMLLDVDAPKFLWEEAVSYACHLKNISPTRALNGITPYQAFWGKVPDVSHVHQFGRPCWVLVPESRRTKLDAKSERYMFTGISEHAAGYRYYVPRLRQILVSRNVLFPPSYGPNLPPSLPAPIVSGLEGESAVADASSSKTETTPAISTADSAPKKATQSPDSATPDLDSLPIIPVPSIPPSSNEDPPVLAPRRSSRQTQKHDYTKLHSRGKQVVSNDAPIAQLPPPRDGHSTLDPPSSSSSFPASESSLTDDPSTFKEVQSRPDWLEWKAAMDAEISQLHQLGTYSLEEPPSDRKPIGCRWVYTIKRDPLGNIVKYKARLVAQGFSQIPGQDFLETYAPVMRLESYRALLALAAPNDWEIHQIDVVGAYLNGELDETIYMRQPPGYEDGSPRACRLHKALYGLKQAGRVWNVKFNEVFVDSLSYTRLQSDFCVYIRRNSDGLVIVIIHVDDSTILASPPSIMPAAKEEISKLLTISDLGPSKTFLGLQIERDRSQKTITIHQSSYITKVLERFGMISSSPVSTPVDSHVKLSTDNSPSVSNFPYAAVIGSLMYAAIATRPDISHAVQKLSQYTSCFTQEHVTAVKRVLRYLNGTRSLGITYGLNEDTTLLGYTDADWGQDVNDRKSVSGYVFLISGGAISWSSKKQTSVALSTMEAEYVALAHATKDAIWIRSLLVDLGFPPPNPTLILCDNQAAIAYAHDNQFHARAKHISMAYHFTRDHITQGDIKVSYVSTKNNCADMFTKGLPRPTHIFLTSSIGMSPS